MFFDVHKHFRAEGHAREMEIAIKAAHLEGILVQRSAARPVGRPTPFWSRDRYRGSLRTAPGPAAGAHEAARPCSPAGVRQG
jgi:hypothetical protein